MTPIILLGGERLLSRFAIPSLLALGAAQCGALLRCGLSPWLLAGFALPLFE
ncbi:hypothetical protein IGB42_00031 [Andreprevotia sp. IGB-42]|uniref:hypothetical protein n=1 Tax=Andreprevotia sp. IGB-42 TaxID=2497473 RepID=UPI00135AC58E|nr:hypothetical protein [Andreprevotia sp. IGB-42]KAF0814955.1 hypothetical protein IGB42_00031 [Andreprevotia sp. IGB-42]